MPNPVSSTSITGSPEDVSLTTTRIVPLGSVYLIALSSTLIRPNLRTSGSHLADTSTVASMVKLCSFSSARILRCSTTLTASPFSFTISSAGWIRPDSPRVRVRRLSTSRVRRSTSSSRLTPQDKPDAADRVEQFRLEWVVDLSPQPGDRHVDHVVQRRGPRANAPDVAREHLSRHYVTDMAQQVLEQLEFLHRELERLPSPHDLPRHEVHRQVILLQLEDLIWAPAAQERTDPRQ